MTDKEVIMRNDELMYTLKIFKKNRIEKYITIHKEN